jgi:hypothetical protein
MAKKKPQGWLSKKIFGDREQKASDAKLRQKWEAKKRQRELFSKWDADEKAKSSRPPESKSLTKPGLITRLKSSLVKKKQVDPAAHKAHHAKWMDAARRTDKNKSIRVGQDIVNAKKFYTAQADHHAGILKSHGHEVSKPSFKKNKIQRTTNKKPPAMAEGVQMKKRLSEISKDLAKKYLGAARADDYKLKTTRPMTKDIERKRENRTKGITRAIDRLIKEKELTEISKQKLMSYYDKAGDHVDRMDNERKEKGYFDPKSKSKSSARKMKKRMDGMDSAETRMNGRFYVGKDAKPKPYFASEENLSEISKKTLKSYIQGASIDKSHKAADIGWDNSSGVHGHGRMSKAEFEKVQKKHSNRSLGIQQAAERLGGSYWSRNKDGRKSEKGYLAKEEKEEKEESKPSSAVKRGLKSAAARIKAKKKREKDNNDAEWKKLAKESVVEAAVRANKETDWNKPFTVQEFFFKKKEKNTPANMSRSNQKMPEKKVERDIKGMSKSSQKKPTFMDHKKSDDSHNKKLKHGMSSSEKSNMSKRLSSWHKKNKEDDEAGLQGISEQKLTETSKLKTLAYMYKARQDKTAMGAGASKMMDVETSQRRAGNTKRADAAGEVAYAAAKRYMRRDKGLTMAKKNLFKEGNMFMAGAINRHINSNPKRRPDRDIERMKKLGKTVGSGVLNLLKKLTRKG